MKEVTTNYKKKEIKTELSLYTDAEEILTASLKDVANNILNLETRLRTEHQEVIDLPDKYIRFEMEIGQGYAEDGHEPKITLYGIRLETDKEYQTRITRHENAIKAAKQSAKKRNKIKKQKELETYLRLQKKFANKKL